MKEFDDNLPKLIFEFFFKTSMGQIFILIFLLIIAYLLIEHLGADNPAEQLIEKLFERKTGIEIDVSQ